MSDEPPLTRDFAARVDFGRTAADYKRHRAGFPPELFQRVRERGWSAPGMAAVDLGVGTGSMARGLALAGLAVTGVDISDALMREAADLDRAAGVTVTYATARAEATGLPAAAYDLVTAGQCWHWFDRAAAAAEACRLLRPAGRIVIAHFDWIPLSGNIAAATEALIRRFNPRWTLGGGSGLYPAWLGDLAYAGFDGIETFSHDVRVPYSHAGWRGRVRASAGVKASLDEAAVARFDAEMAAMLATDFPREPLEILHRIWVASAVRGAAG